MSKKKSKKTAARRPSKHVLYEASVQCVDADLDFFQRIFRNKRRRPLRRIQEDFCGTAALAVAWVARHDDNRAFGLDLDRPTLNWGLAHHAAHLGDDARRLRLTEGNVLTARRPRAELVAALNFSFMVFKERSVLLRYFKKVRRSLGDDGIFVLDCFGGTESACELTEERRIPRSKGPDGETVPSFVYVWEQAAFNPITHEIRCHIHFVLPDGTRMNRAFTYDWRLWTVPELREVLIEAGFADVEVYLEDWDDDLEDTDGIFRRRTTYDNEGSWIGYVVGIA